MLYFQIMKQVHFPRSNFWSQPLKVKSKSDENDHNSAPSLSGSKIQSDNDSRGDDGLFELDSLNPAKEAVLGGSFEGHQT